MLVHTINVVVDDELYEQLRHRIEKRGWTWRKFLEATLRRMEAENGQNGQNENKEEETE